MMTLKFSHLSPILAANYSKKKETNEKVYSQPLYTSSGGCRLRIIVYPNGYGNGKDTHISVLVKHDSMNWPFVGSVKLELLNQLQDNNHYHMTVSFNEARQSQGYFKYVAHSQLSEGPVDSYASLYTQYLKDDTLYFRITVKPSWLECTATTTVELPENKPLNRGLFKISTK